MEDVAAAGGAGDDVDVVGSYYYDYRHNRGSVVYLDFRRDCHHYDGRNDGLEEADVDDDDLEDDDHDVDTDLGGAGDDEDVVARTHRCDDVGHGSTVRTNRMTSQPMDDEHHCDDDQDDVDSALFGVVPSCYCCCLVDPLPRPDYSRGAFVVVAAVHHHQQQTTWSPLHVDEVPN